jgi:hypothetical protein
MKQFFAWIASFFSNSQEKQLEGAGKMINSISWPAGHSSWKIRRRSGYNPDDAIVHSRFESVVILRFRQAGSLQQVHVIEPDAYAIHVRSYDWPKISKTKEPAAMCLWVRNPNKEHGTIVTFEDNVHWVSRKGVSPKPDPFNAKHPIIRFWSWGDGIVYAGEMYQRPEDDVL